MIIKSKYENPWPTWTAVDDNVRAMWFEEFKKKYKWLPDISCIVIRDIFEHKGSIIFKNIMDKLRTGKDKGRWISPDVRKGLQNYWDGDDFKRKSAIGKKNRAVDSGASLYTGGSVSTAVIRKRLILELGREPTAFEIMGKTKKNKEGKWANKKAEDLADEYIQRRSVAHESQSLQGELDIELSTAEDNAIFLDVVGGP